MEPAPTDTIRETIAATVRAELAARNISGSEAARLSGISYQTLRRYLDGTRDFPVPALYQVAEAIGVNPSLLISRATERMSDMPPNVTPIGGRNAAAHLTAEELEAMTLDKAANRDTEIMRGSDDPD